MEIRSLADLTQLADRVEMLATELRGVSTPEPGVHIPDLPLPLSLESIENWMRAVDECRRRPRLARSKHLLETRGIDTASIPAAVLESSEDLSVFVEKIDMFPGPIQEAAFTAIGRALTKGINDGTVVIEQFSDAVNAIDDLERDALNHPWVYKFAAQSIAEKPTGASEIAQKAAAILEHVAVANDNGIVVANFEGLDEALQALTTLSEMLAERNRRFAEEELSVSHNVLEGQNVQTATEVLRQTVERLNTEKNGLMQRAVALVQQLESVGGTSQIDAVTIAELRKRVPELSRALEERRRFLRQSVGKDVYRIVESLAKGEVPSIGKVEDAALGHAIRKAVDCGYRIHLEAPRED